DRTTRFEATSASIPAHASTAMGTQAAIEKRKPLQYNSLTVGSAIRHSHLGFVVSRGADLVSAKSLVFCEVPSFLDWAASPELPNVTQPHEVPTIGPVRELVVFVQHLGS
ncbi:MAG: hypothetical protein ABIP48_21505, partial [Planctomycetota bacterium]